MGHSFDRTAPLSNGAAGRAQAPAGDDHLLARPLPAPYQLAIEGMPFQLTVLDGTDAAGPTGGAGAAPRDSRLAPQTWFSVALSAATKKRYLYLVQKDAQTGVVDLLLLCDRQSLEGDPPALGLRMPPHGAWLRALVDGCVHVLASDLVLNRKSVTAWIGGRDPTARRQT